MLRTRMRIGGRDYLLPSEADPETVMANITALVRAGGGFVQAVRLPDRAVDVFVSRGMDLSIEVTESEPDDEAPGDTDEPWVQSDFDPRELL